MRSRYDCPDGHLRSAAKSSLTSPTESSPGKNTALLTVGFADGPAPLSSSGPGHGSAPFPYDPVTRFIEALQCFIMRRTLTCHPASPCSALTGIQVEIGQPRAARLLLSYAVTGRISDLCLPAVTPPIRSDELWRHTCFEAFVGALDGSGYYEFNFAPSTRWAAYRFAGYRNGMAVASEIGTPAIEVQSNSKSYTLQTTLPLGCLSALPREARWRLGLSAVIEETNGRLSYWALAHPPGRPDFHHADCFAHELPSTLGRSENDPT